MAWCEFCTPVPRSRWLDAIDVSHWKHSLECPQPDVALVIREEPVISVTPRASYLKLQKRV